MFSTLRNASVAFVTLLLAVSAGAATDHFGRVTFGGLPGPGASVTATQGDQKAATVTNQDGVFRLTALADGTWIVRVEMPGFAPASQEIAIAGETTTSTWELHMLPLDEMTRGVPAASKTDRPADVPPERPAAAGKNGPAPASPTPASPPAGFQRAQVNTSAGGAAIVNDPSVSADGDRGANDGFLINGSVNNGAASPFAQLAAFGNNRRNARSLYNGGIGVLLGNSALDSRPYSFTGQNTDKPSYNNTQIVASLAGPLKIPNLLPRGPNMFLGYQRTIDNNASTQSALMPTALERAGDFSQTRDQFGRLVQLLDPATGRPFTGNVIPAGRISSQAASLLNYYPLPNIEPGGRFNYQTSVLETRHQDAAQARLRRR